MIIIVVAAVVIAAAAAAVVVVGDGGDGVGTYTMKKKPKNAAQRVRIQSGCAQVGVCVSCDRMLHARGCVWCVSYLSHITMSGPVRAGYARR